ncbi:MAG: hypothetical protein PHU85_19375, partial [Phycisphaerae bacterium]|nr:hypothetical protein [Phycisphaerae bacterium]
DGPISRNQATPTPDFAPSLISTGRRDDTADRLMADEVVHGWQADVLLKKLFGIDEPVFTATFMPQKKPLFDYQAEVARAKKAEPTMLDKLGLTAK